MTAGADRIAEAFRGATGGTALMPYMMGGFPDVPTSLAVGKAYIEGGADLIELGVPFSDPLADGPVIQAAGNRALAAGTTTKDVLEICSVLAAHVPVIVMVYVNIVLAAGVESFAAKLAAAGASGMIVPDLPLEESEAARAACDAAGIALIPLVAPTSSADRMERIGRSASGFLYAVSVTGTTGERATLPELYGDTIARAREHSSVPVALGFGIAEPEQAVAAAAAGADGVIIGSRLVRAVGEAADAGSDPAEAARALVAAFRAALG